MRRASRSEVIYQIIIDATRIRYTLFLKRSTFTCRDPSCCTITLCDVTLGDHEIKPENVGDLSVNLTDVKVLNSTAIKLKLSPGSSEDVVIEISENNHVWTMVKPSKGMYCREKKERSYLVFRSVFIACDTVTSCR